MRSSWRIAVLTTCGLAILLIVEPSCSSPTSVQKKAGYQETESLSVLLKAGDEGDADAQAKLGAMYYSGTGVPQDYAEAICWYRKAADQGDASSQLLLGGMYSEGTGVPQDRAEATRWYRKAADQGHADAQFLLGLMYDNGIGVPQDYMEAHVWLNLAASRASGDQQTEYANVRDLVAKKMTSQQIAEAQRRAREWKPKSGADQGKKPME